jgi:predicted Zn-dependent protease
MGSLLSSVEFKQYRQGHEDQADQFGVLTLKQVGLDPQAGARSLGYLATIYGYAQENSAIINTILCSDHPDSLARVERAANLGRQVAFARRVDPSQWPAQVDLSTIRVRYAQSKFAEAYGQRNYSDALGWLERGLKHAPDEPVLLYDKACVFTSLDQLDGAISLLRTAIELQPDLRDFAKTDRDLNPLASIPEFQALVGTAAAP